MATIRTTSAYLETPIGSTGTGLDQVLGWIARDGGLAGANEAGSIAAGLAAVDGLNRLLVQGLQAIGRLDARVITVDDLKALNAWIRDPAVPERLALFIALHGDDDGASETGLHTIQGDGGQRKFDGKTLIDTVLDGIYHIGFPLSADGTRLTNEDGADNAALTDVARWLTLIKNDLATTGTGLDRIVETIVADPGLQASISTTQISGGATAANDLNSLILEGIAALTKAGAADGDSTRLSASELTWINTWIRQDPERLARFVALHGDDENGSETGYHLVQSDGATTRLFGNNAVNTIYDGIYHVGFTINADGRFQNEDGDANATVTDVAEWITYYYGDPSTTGSGMDRLVDWIQLDSGLARNTSARDINDGLAAANDLNALLLEAIDATGVNLDGLISRTDLRTVNQWIRDNRYAAFVALHGDDENGVETGFHLIQGDGANTQFFGQNLVNTVADGIYHYGFEIQGENFVNEDGDTNQSLSDVSGWVNSFLNDIRLTTGTWDADVLIGNDEADQILAYGGNDLLDGLGGADLLDGSWGKDTLNGGLGQDQLDGGFDNDQLDGGEDSDTYLVRGAGPDWVDGVPYSFEGYDIYADTGSSGTDRILAEGDGGVDIGLLNFGPGSGIEEIVNASGGEARLLGNWQANTLDFSATSLVGGGFLIDAADGKDTVMGSAVADRIRGGGDNDLLNGGEAGDTYEVSGAGPDWVDGVPYTFQGYDIYADSGSSGTDRIVAVGDGPVDLGLLQFDAASGIEEIVNASGGEVRLLGNWQANTLDFSATSLVGGGFLIDAADGKDKVVGSAVADRIRGGGDNDWLNGGEAGDTYEVSGAGPDWVDGVPYTFQGYDTYADSGSSGTDRIVAIGAGPVDIGLLQFSAASSGIEAIVNETGAEVRLLGNWEANSLDFSGVSLQGGGFLIDADDGKDTVMGSAVADRIRGGGDNDWLNGGEAGDTYEVSGAGPDWVDGVPYTFQGYDTYADSGSTGVDRILVLAPTGTEAVDIGFLHFGPTSGIELIDASTTSGAVRLLGDWQANTLDFSATELRGSTISIALNDGNDTFVGSAAADLVDAGSGSDNLRGGAGDDTFSGGAGDDALDGGNGSDTYRVSGTQAAGSKVFGGYDTYADSGSTGIDRIVAFGAGDVDIGLAGGNFQASNGIEQIVNSATSTLNGVATAARVRLLGSSAANTLDFRTVALIGGNFRIEAGDGNDTVSGSSTAETIVAGKGDDQLNGGGGADTYEISGNSSSGFQGYDTYADSGSGNGERDRIVVVAATGSEAVDIGLKAFSSASGIEQIDASGTSGRVRLLGDSNANSLNFSGVDLVGANLLIDAGSGNDSVVGSAVADNILGGSGVDQLLGGEGNDTLSGGAGLDVINGGAGADTVVLTTLTDAIIGGSSSSPQFEKVTGFTVGLDRFDLATTPPAGAFKTLGSVSALTTAAITTLLNTTNFQANGAATFSFGSGASQRTFIAFNDSVAGYKSSTDAIVEITSFNYASGFNSLSQISLV